MFGITDPAKKRGLFGKPVEYYGTPPIHNPMQHTPEMRQAAQPAPQQGGKNPSVLPYALAGLQDFVALRMGYRPQGVATLNAQTAQQQQAAADAAAAQRKRAQELADWQWKQEWERDNPKPVSNDTVADYEFIKGQLGEEAAKQYLQNRADPPQYRQGADGRFYRIETGQAPTAPVGKLTPIGGPTQPASGGF